MPEDLWHYHHDGAQYGPVPLETLQEAAEDGQLLPEDLVWRDGTPDWVPAKTIEGLFRAEPDPVPAPEPERRTSPLAVERQAAMLAEKQAQRTNLEDRLVHLKAVDRMLNNLAGRLSVGTLDSTDDLAKNVGHIAYPLSSVLAIIAIIVAAIKFETPILMLFVIVVALANLVLHYAAMLFLDAGKTLIEKSPSSLSSNAVLRLLALAMYIFAILSLPSVLLFGLGIPIVLISLYYVGITLNPEAVNVTIGKDVTAGEEAIGLLMFLCKAALRLVPIVFGGCSLIAAMAMLGLIFLLFGDMAPVAMAAMPVAIGWALAVAALPFLLYLNFLISYLGIDILRAILVVPGKLDTVRDHLAAARRG